MEEISHKWALSGPNIGEGNNVCKGFGAGEILVCWRNRKISVGGGWGWQGGVCCEMCPVVFKQRVTFLDLCHRKSPFTCWVVNWVIDWMGQKNK